jgi:uncharacterized protein with ParB-like and HNH nuclease domain
MNEHPESIKSEDITLGKLFDDFYVVPDYQREYVWQDDEVGDLLGDIHAEFSTNHTISDHEYFIGSVVVCPAKDGLLELIDGQQRLTTTYLFLCAVRDHLKDQGRPVIGELPNLIVDVRTDSRGEDVQSYRLVLQYDDSADVLTRIANEDRKLEGLPDTTSIENIRNAYQYIREFLQSRFGDDVQRLRLFYKFFTSNVKLIRIRTRSRAHALKIFETINARGKSLDSMDLLKNLLFMSADANEFSALKTKWKELVDTLHLAGEKPLRFLRYYILANYKTDTLIREDDIYEWFTGNESQCGYRQSPMRFVDSLLGAVRAYRLFLECRNANGEYNRYLANIYEASRAGRQHLILLLAARQSPPEVFAQLTRHVENLVFAYAITRENTREFERKFSQWAAEVRDIKTLEQLESFVSARLHTEKINLASRFEQAFRDLDASRLQRYRLRYVLAKLTQYVNERAYGTETKLETYINSKVDVEHILPQSPSVESLAEFDAPDEVEAFVQRLGNLALAEKPLNTSLGNRPYSEKRKEYPKSQFLLTQAIAQRPVLGIDTSVNRAVRDLRPHEEWTSGSIVERQADLAQLAFDVWDVPATVGAVVAATPPSAATESDPVREPTIQRPVAPDGKSEYKQRQQRFWTSFKDSVPDNSTIKCANPAAHHYIHFAVGLTGAYLSASMSQWDLLTGEEKPEQRVQLVFNGSKAKQRFGILEASKEAIATALGLELVWISTPDNQRTRICTRHEADIANEQEWPQQFQWFRETLVLFYEVFTPRLKTIDQPETKTLVAHV